MAEGKQFNPQLPDDNLQNYLGYSKGIDVNTAIGGALSSGADLLDKELVATDKLRKEQIRSDLTTQVDRTRDQEINKGASLLGYNQDAAQVELPGPLKDSLNRAKVMGDAKGAGRIGGSHYMMLLDATARQLRTNYPGYREHIDNVMADLVGTTPANQIVKDLQSEIRSGQSDEDKQRRKFVEHHMNAGSIPGNYKVSADFMPTDLNGKPVDFAQFSNDVVVLTKNKYDNETTRNNLAEEKSRGEVSKSNFTRAAHREVAIDLQQAMTSAQGPSRKFIEGIEALEAKAGGRPYSPEEEGQVRAAMSAVRNQFLSAQRAKLFEVNKQGFSFAAEIGKDGVEDVIKTYDQYLHTLEDRAVNKDTGFLKFNTILTESIKASDIATAYKTDNVMRLLNVVKEGYGTQGMSVIMSSSEAIRSWGTSLFEKKALLEPAKSVGAIFDEMKAAGNVSNEAYMNVLNNKIRILNTPEAPMKLIEDQAKGLFGPENADFLSKIANPHGTYLKMAGNPQTVNTMAKLKDTNPELYTNWRNWVTGSFQQVGVPLANQANAIAMEEGYNLTYDPKTYSYRLDAASNFKMNNAVGRSYQDQITKLNTSIQAVVPMLKKEGGDVEGQVQELVRSLGINTSATKQTGVMQSLWEAVDNSFRAAKGEVPSSGPGSSTGTQPRHIAGLLDLTGKLEAGKHGYNEVYGKKDAADLTNMTLADVFKLQNQMRSEGGVSTAVGKYQFIQSTLQKQAQKLGIDQANTKFTPELQDRLALSLMKEKGLDQFLTGQMSKDQFADNMAEAWAAYPTASGKSRYDGVAGNKAGIGREQFLKHLDHIQKQYRTEGQSERPGADVAKTHTRAGESIPMQFEGMILRGPNQERYQVKNGRAEPLY